MARSTVHYADSETNNILKKLHNKLRPAGTPVQRVEYIIELLLLRIFEVRLAQDPEFEQLRGAFRGENENLLFSSLLGIANDQILPMLNAKFFPFYAHILSEARKVWKGNLSTKVQDQLVLIEEVFSNSNFSNNVTSGNMGEIIGLVAELDKDRLLKTDLLGDTIESALSETGGTKDIGLHRTPDHIRQFMVGLAAPTFDDQIFDPTVGTGGFMFDSFEYVMQGVSQDAQWPGPKSHPELATWFKDWFAKHPVPMPSIETTTDFYRTGVGGIEYLGMVRKMAAINFYVRGLNPGNIQQGDALEKFGTEILPKSKTVILANPPFGAERDKESYPNVWSEYPTESETTILFVKLMLESLKPGGRCAVIVSEGFLTWDQNSARALRRALLDECELKAIISLPQGLFVSKGGQGPKTSILYFVKGGRTRNVWFYKVSNDGYTMGTNRKPIFGCQLVEALDLFHRYTREDKQSPEMRHSFCIPAAWIKVLDPRVKDKIRTETRAEMSSKAAEEKTKLAEKLAVQVAAKKLTATEHKDRLAQHDELWLSKTENTIAQKIERAHLYSFNLPNYRSRLTPAQVEAWKDFAATYVREADPSKTLEKQYHAIAAAGPDELDELVSGLEPRHTLELDIARQFLAGLSPQVITKHPHLRTLQEIIASQQKTPRVQLKELLEPVSRPVVLEEGRTYRRVTVKLYGKGILLRDRVTVDDLKGDKWFQVKAGDLIFSKIDARNGAFGLIPEALDDGIVTNEFPIFAIKESECPPPLLSALLASNQFYGQIEAKVSGATGRRRFEPEELLEMELPLPAFDVREAIAAKLASSARLIKGAEVILSEWHPSEDLFVGGTKTPLGEVANITRGKFSHRPRNHPAFYGGDHPFIQINDITATRKIITEFSQTLNEKGLGVSKKFPKGTLVLSIASSIGQVGILGVDSCFPDSLVAITTKDERAVSTEYLFWFLKTFQSRVAAMSDVALQANINVEKLESFPIHIHSPQNAAEIVSVLNAQLVAVEAVERLGADAELVIKQTFNRIWES